MKKALKPETILFPCPVLIVGTYDENGVPDAMNAAWGGISDYNEITISMSSHRTTANVVKSKGFTVAFADVKNMVVSDFVGIVSQNQDPDKMKKAGLHDSRSKLVNAPIFEEFPVTMELELISFEDGLLKGKIVGFVADEDVLAPDGKIDITKCHFITYDGSHHNYVELGGIVGKAFSSGLKLK